MDKNLEALENIFTLINEKKYKAFISTITVSEIFAVFTKSAEIKKAVETIVNLKAIGVEIINVNEEIAKNGGIFKGVYSKAKKGFSYGDALILSTAISTRSQFLLTFDPEFSGVKEIPIVRPEDLKVL